jgi:enoyl-CoA hydratase/carnithine racemase
MVNHLVDSREVLEKAMELAEAVAANAPLAVRASLRMARAAPQYPEEEIRRLQRKMAPPLRSSLDAKQGRNAFLEKRQPKWQGREPPIRRPSSRADRGDTGQSPRPDYK